METPGRLAAIPELRGESPRGAETGEPRGLPGAVRLLASLLVFGLLGTPQAAQRVEVLRSSGGLPPHIVGTFREPSVFQQAADGRYFVFDRRGQAVHRIDADYAVTKRVVQIGPEDGRILGASTFDLGPASRFVVADAPAGRERVQTFDLEGARVGSFRLSGQAAPRLTIGAIVLNGVGSLEFTGRSMLMSQPESGGLVTRFSLIGRPYHTFGALRRTGHEADRDLHLALNSGLPLAAPDGHHYFVFQAGVPMFRKYDRNGTLLFERHIEGTDLDPIINKLPTVWPKRPVGRGLTLPVVPPTVRTAAVDRAGNLWVALSAPVLYVYDPTGEKIRTVRLEAAGPVNPSSLHFPDDTRMLVAPGCYEFKVW